MYPQPGTSLSVLSLLVRLVRLGFVPISHEDNPATPKVDGERSCFETTLRLRKIAIYL